jgi:hypothetical protein
VAQFELNEELERKYRQAALALWELPDVPQELEPDSSMPIHPWEPGVGRRSIAARYALIALRLKRVRVGHDAPLTEPDRGVLRRYIAAASDGFETYEGQTKLASARYLALKALVEESGFTFTPSGITFTP